MTPLSLVPAPAADRPEPRSPLLPTAGVAFAIFLLGTLGYAVGVTQWSGRQIASFDARALAIAAGSGARVVGPVHLDPAMSPVRVLAHVSYRSPDGRPMSCRVTMRGADGRKVWSASRSFGATAVGQTNRRSIGATLAVETFDVPRAGDYSFAVDVRGDAPGALHGVRLELRRQVASVQAWFVVTGALLALASLVVVLLTWPRPVRAGGRRSRAA